MHVRSCSSGCGRIDDDDGGDKDRLVWVYFVISVSCNGRITLSYIGFQNDFCYHVDLEHLVILRKCGTVIFFARQFFGSVTDELTFWLSLLLC